MSQSSDDFNFTCGFIVFSLAIELVFEELLTDVIEVAGALVAMTIGFPRKLLGLDPMIPLADTGAFA